ncbi:MAG TPA: hypothetical protein VJ821_12740 [Anaerolineales bacterium]|nr:hypothetical protein [Anaerolineales bacterium]
MKTHPNFFYFALASILLLSMTTLPIQDASLLSLRSAGGSQDARSYPADPTADIPWSGGTNGVADIQAAFNNARTQENIQLGKSIPMLTLPSQTEWNGMSDGQKALWLINRERIDRGVAPLHGLETNAGGVAQYYADYLLDNNTWGHTADGRDPWERLSDNPAIGACHDFLSISENLAVFVTSGSSIALPIERAIYMWMYEDGPCCGWGHRHAILWHPYNDNSGTAGQEGFLGIGRANGGPYKGPFSQPWPFAEIIVMNVFDPCSAWIQVGAPDKASLIAPSGTITDTTPVYSWNVSPDTDTADPATWYYLWVTRPSGEPIKTWYLASDVCSGGTCSVEHPTDLTGGAHSWWIRTWNQAGYGPWSIRMDFSVMSSAIPGQADPISPNGNITDTTPEYTWDAVSDAEWYYLWVKAPSGNGYIKQWFTATQAGCPGGTGTCSATASKALALGNHTFFVRTWSSSAGYGPWSGGLDFNVTTLGAVTLISPSGNITDTTPTYTWNAVSGAEWYYLWVNAPSGTGYLKQWFTAAQAGCAAGTGTCSVTPTTAVAFGAHTFYVRPWSSGAAYGPWSGGLDFNIVP